MAMFFIDLGRLRQHFVRRELARGLLHRGLIFGRREIHDDYFPVKSQGDAAWRGMPPCLLFDLRSRTFGERGLLGDERLLERQRLALVDQALDLGDRVRPVRGDPLGERDDLRHQLGGRHDRVGEADAQRLVRRRSCRRSCTAPWPSRRRPGGRAAGCRRARDDAELDLGLPELRALGGVDEVAAQRELAAAAEREAIDRGDPRLLRRLDRVANARAVLDERRRLLRGHLRHLGDIGAGDECFHAAAGERDDAHGGVAFDLARRRARARPSRCSTARSAPSRD